MGRPVGSRPQYRISASRVVDLKVSPIATVIIKNRHTHVAQWVPMDGVGGEYMGCDTDRSGSQNVRQATSVMDVGRIGGRGGGVRETTGGLTVGKVGEWGRFTSRVVALSDSGTQRARLYGAKRILNPTVPGPCANTQPAHQFRTPRRVSQGSEHACSLFSDGTSIVRSFSDKSISSAIVRVVPGGWRSMGTGWGVGTGS